MTQEGRRGTLLIVDDEEAIGRMLKQWLSGQGYQVEYAADFAAVRQAMQKTPFMLVTLDIIMPGVDGLEILKWLRAHYPDTGVVMATALDSVDTVIEAMRQGAIDYLLKPLNLELASEEIARAMERQRLVAENRRYQQELERLVDERTQALQAAQKRLERQVRELEGRDRLVRLQVEAHTYQEVDAEVFVVLQQVFGSRWAVLYRPDSDRGRLEVVASMGQQPALTMAPEALVGRAFAGRRLERGREASVVAAPIVYREQALGVLLIDCPQSEEQEETLNQLWRLSAEIALAWQSAAMAQDLANGVLSSVEELAQLE